MIDRDGVIRSWDVSRRVAKRRTSEFGDDLKIRAIEPGLLGPPLPDEAAAKAFDAPTSDGTQITAASDWHDIEQQLAAGKLEGSTIDLDDGKGERSLAEVIEDLKADEAAAAALREARGRSAGAWRAAGRSR